VLKASQQGADSCFFEVAVARHDQVDRVHGAHPGVKNFAGWVTEAEIPRAEPPVSSRLLLQHTAAERRASLERSSYLNDAYRVLKQPATRIGYLLELEGFRAKAEDPSRASKEVPPALLEEVFALNEELDEVRELRASGAARTTGGPACSARDNRSKTSARNMKSNSRSCRRNGTRWWRTPRRGAQAPRAIVASSSARSGSACSSATTSATCWPPLNERRPTSGHRLRATGPELQAEARSLKPEA